MHTITFNITTTDSGRNCVTDCDAVAVDVWPMYGLGIILGVLALCMVSAAIYLISEYRYKKTTIRREYHKFGQRYFGFEEAIADQYHARVETGSDR